MRKGILSLLLLFSISTQFACSDSGVANSVANIFQPAPKPIRNIVVVIDFSSSPNSSERQSFYKQTLEEQIIKRMGPYDIVTVLPLDKAAVTNTQELLSASFADMKIVPDYGAPKDIEDKTNQALERERVKAVQDFSSKYADFAQSRGSSSGGTDLFGLLKVLPKYVRAEATNYLVFMSDMMNFTSELNMEIDDGSFSRNALKAAIAKAPDIDLKGAKIFVLTGDQPKVSRAHFELVQDYWTEYFKNRGSDTLEYTSSSTSKLAAVMNSP